MAAVWLQTQLSMRGREPPELAGFEALENLWRLRIDYYQKFLAEVTGITPSHELSPSELKTIQSRLEGCIETYEHEGHCMCDEFSRYEYIDSIADVHELSRFFRVLVTNRIEDPGTA
jgi:hypothetical protein